MKKYDVYGIGAALVDTEVEVSDAFLASAQIDKGVMTLVDEARQSELLAALASENTHMLRKCGGSVCNSVVAASSLALKLSSAVRWLMMLTGSFISMICKTRV